MMHSDVDMLEDMIKLNVVALMRLTMRLPRCLRLADTARSSPSHRPAIAPEILNA